MTASKESHLLNIKETIHVKTNGISKKNMWHILHEGLSSAFFFSSFAAVQAATHPAIRKPHMQL